MLLSSKKSSIEHRLGYLCSSKIYQGNYTSLILFGWWEASHTGPLKKHPIHKQRWYSWQHARDLYMANNNLTRNGGALSLSVGVVGRNWQRLSFLRKTVGVLSVGLEYMKFSTNIYIIWMVNVDHRGASCHIYILYIHIIKHNLIYMCPKISNP